VTLGNVVAKADATKIRRVGAGGKVLVGFAGSAADAFALLERLEKKLGEFPDNTRRAAVELAKDWRTDRVLRRLEAMLAVVDKTTSLIISGAGDVIEPTDGVIGIGSGGPYAPGRRQGADRAFEPVRQRNRRVGPEDRGRDLHLHEHQRPRRDAVKPHADIEVQIASESYQPAGEDHVAVFDHPTGRVVVIADGVGGRRNGGPAADAIVRIATEAAARMADACDGDVWCEVLADSDARICADTKCGETTAVIVGVSRERIEGASVGDSGAWLIDRESYRDLTRIQQRKPYVGSGAGAADSIPRQIRRRLRRADRRHRRPAQVH